MRLKKGPLTAAGMADLRKNAFALLQRCARLVLPPPPSLMAVADIALRATAKGHTITPKQRAAALDAAEKAAPPLFVNGSPRYGLKSQIPKAALATHKVRIDRRTIAALLNDPSFRAEANERNYLYRRMQSGQPTDEDRRLYLRADQVDGWFGWDETGLGNRRRSEMERARQTRATRRTAEASERAARRTKAGNAPAASDTRK
jgi:hypothetical protein